MGKIADEQMRPAPNVVFVKEAPFEIKKNKFEYAEDKKKDYVVVAVGENATAKVGDYILFDNCHEYEFKGEKIIKVNIDDIHGIAHA